MCQFKLPLTFRFPCGTCHYIAGYKNDLKKHVLSIHIGQRYSCDLCENKATDKINLEDM